MQFISFPNNNRESLDSAEQQHRDLLFLGRSVYCTKRGGVLNTYETRSIFLLFRNFFIRRGAMAGTCPSVCDDICNHKPCIDDFEINEEAQECYCIPDGETRCGGNTACVSDQCRCLNGYEGNPGVSSGACTDINECNKAMNLSNCGANSFCTNFPGSFNCTCLRGYQGDPVAGCSDVDECAANTNICGEFGTCVNTIGAYNCVCAPGFQWDAPFGICKDINECITTNCGANSICTNSPGSYKCSCTNGYNSTGEPPVQPCNDIDECREDTNRCGNNATCFNLPGSVRCRCNRGFIGSPPNCQPDVCTLARNGTVCGENTQCLNATAVCQCLVGYEGNPNVNCTDINECANPTACPTSSQCFNKPATFECLITERNLCPTKRDSTCLTGLKCAQESRSVSTYRCCSSTGSCAGGVCCNGYYREGEVCSSRNDLDCQSGLKCAPAVLLSTVYKCCKNTLLGACV